MEIALLDVLVDQVHACGKLEKDFKLSQWNAREKAFIMAIDMTMRRENFKNKLKTWDKNYEIVKTHINHTRFGWDSVRLTMTGIEDLWEQYIAVSLFLALLWYLSILLYISILTINNCPYCIGTSRSQAYQG
ncbi:hypothetical protein AMTRI_Chr03g47950 [Amborella trichopoda]